jgi:cbb3-type cytochrome oxidase subunit 3
MAKKIISLTLAVFSLCCFFFAGYEYLCWEQTKGGFSVPTIISVIDYKKMSDSERVAHDLSQVNYTYMLEADTAFELLTILFFLIFCIFLYLFIFNSSNKEKRNLQGN